MDRQISVPIKKEDAVSLRAGDYVTLTGTIYTARDASTPASRMPVSVSVLSLIKYILIAGLHSW